MLTSVDTSPLLFPHTMLMMLDYFFERLNQKLWYNLTNHRFNVFWGFSSTLVLNRRHIEATVLYIEHACKFVVLLKEKTILSPFSWRYNRESLIT